MVWPWCGTHLAHLMPDICPTDVKLWLIPLVWIWPTTQLTYSPYKSGPLAELPDLLLNFRNLTRNLARSKQWMGLHQKFWCMQNQTPCRLQIVKKDYLAYWLLVEAKGEIILSKLTKSGGWNTSKTLLVEYEAAWRTDQNNLIAATSRHHILWVSQCRHIAQTCAKYSMFKSKEAATFSLDVRSCAVFYEFCPTTFRQPSHSSVCSFHCLLCFCY